ncbi:MAG: hypothetical protein WCN95_07975 [bacterium]
MLTEDISDRRIWSGQAKNCNQRKALFEYLYDKSKLYENKVVVIIGCCSDVLGPLMTAHMGKGGKNGLTAAKVYVTDAPVADCDCIDRPAPGGTYAYGTKVIVLPEAGLTPAAVGCIGLDRPDLIIFTHPLYFADCPKKGVNHSDKSDRYDALGVVLEKAREILQSPQLDERDHESLENACSVLIPYFDPHDGMHDKSDPGLCAFQHGYWTFWDSPPSIASSNARQEDIKFYRLVYRSECCCRFQENGLLRGSLSSSRVDDHAYETADWLKVIASEGKQEDAGAIPKGLFKTLVGQEIANTCLSGALGRVGMMPVYYDHAARSGSHPDQDSVYRLATEVFLPRDSTLEKDHANSTPEWITRFNSIYKDDDGRKAEAQTKHYDLTAKMLAAFERRAMQLTKKMANTDMFANDVWTERPFFISCQADARSASLSETNVGVMTDDGISDMRLFQSCLSVHYTLPSLDSIQSLGQMSYDEMLEPVRAQMKAKNAAILPPSDLKSKLPSRPDSTVHRYLDDGTGMTHWDELAFFLDWYHEFFVANELLALEDKGLPNLTLTLLPLWIGTAFKPVSLGSVILFTSGRPDRAFINGVICTAIQFLQPIRIHQLEQKLEDDAKELARKAATEERIAAQWEMMRNMSHAIKNALLPVAMRAASVKKVADEALTDLATAFFVFIKAVNCAGKTTPIAKKIDSFKEKHGRAPRLYVRTLYALEASDEARLAGSELAKAVVHMYDRAPVPGFIYETSHERIAAQAIAADVRASSPNLAETVDFLPRQLGDIAKASARVDRINTFMLRAGEPGRDISLRIVSASQVNGCRVIREGLASALRAYVTELEYSGSSYIEGFVDVVHQANTGLDWRHMVPPLASILLPLTEADADDRTRIKPLADLCGQYGMDKDGIPFSLEVTATNDVDTVSNLCLDEEPAVVASVVFNEFLMNALKYGRPSRFGLRICLHLSMSKSPEARFLHVRISNSIADAALIGLLDRFDMKGDLSDDQKLLLDSGKGGLKSIKGNLGYLARLGRRIHSGASFAVGEDVVRVELRIPFLE